MAQINDARPKARYTANFALKLLRDAAFLVGEKWCPPSSFVHFAERTQADPVSERGPKALFRVAFLGNHVQHLRQNAVHAVQEVDPLGVGAKDHPG